MPVPSSSRSGILAAGNFIIDHVKIIDYYPAEENLATILSQASSNGGGPYNVLKDLAKMGADFPLEAAGLIGNDDGSRWIQDDCRQHGIGTSGLRQAPDVATSYTDAFTVQSTGRRTFFHQPGANAQLGVEHFDFSRSTARWFYLGYLMLLDTLDAIRPDGRTDASRVLEAASSAGLRTMADLVSKEHRDFSASARASLPWVDVLVLNEIEAGRIVGIDLRPAGQLDLTTAVHAARQLLADGVREWVVIHCVEGGIATGRHGEMLAQGSLHLPENFIQGATGAGDAFAAGLIHGLHEGLPMDKCLHQAVCAAACCLSHPSTSEGMRPLAACLALGEEFGCRPLH